MYNFVLWNLSLRLMIGVPPRLIVGYQLAAQTLYLLRSIIGASIAPKRDPKAGCLGPRTSPQSLPR